jgi:hypothetical protein
MQFSSGKLYTILDTTRWSGDDDDKLYLTTLTLSAKAGFHNGRVNKRKFRKNVKGSKKLHAYVKKKIYYNIR